MAEMTINPFRLNDIQKRLLRGMHKSGTLKATPEEIKGNPRRNNRMVREKHKIDQAKGQRMNDWRKTKYGITAFYKTVALPKDCARLRDMIEDHHRKWIDEHHAGIARAAKSAQPGQYIATWTEYENFTMTAHVATVNSKDEAMMLATKRPLMVYGPIPEHLPDEGKDNA